MGLLLIAFYSTNPACHISRLYISNQSGTYLQVLQPVLTLGAALLVRGLLTRVTEALVEDMMDTPKNQANLAACCSVQVA